MINLLSNPLSLHPQDPFAQSLWEEVDKSSSSLLVLLLLFLLFFVQNVPRSPLSLHPQDDFAQVLLEEGDKSPKDNSPKDNGGAVCDEDEDDDDDDEVDNAMGSSDEDEEEDDHDEDEDDVEKTHDDNDGQIESNAISAEREEKQTDHHAPHASSFSSSSSPSAIQMSNNKAQSKRSRIHYHLVSVHPTCPPILRQLSPSSAISSSAASASRTAISSANSAIPLLPRATSLPYYASCSSSTSSTISGASDRSHDHDHPPPPPDHRHHHPEIEDDMISSSVSAPVLGGLQEPDSPPRPDSVKQEDEKWSSAVHRYWRRIDDVYVLCWMMIAIVIPMIRMRQRDDEEERKAGCESQTPHLDLTPSSSKMGNWSSTVHRYWRRIDGVYALVVVAFHATDDDENEAMMHQERT